MSKKTPRVYTKANTLRQITLANMQKRPEKVAYKYQNREKEIVDVTFADFYYTTEKLIAAFKKSGLAGKRIAIIGETCPEWLEMFFATISSGSVAIPFDKELLVTEIKGFIEISKADAIFFSPKYAKKYTELKEAGALDNLEYIIPADLSEMEGVDDKRVVPFYDFISGAEIETIMPSEIMRA